MPVLDAKKSNFISREVNAAAALIDALNQFDLLRREWDAQNYGVSITSEDIQGDNGHVTVESLASGFVTLDALKSVLAVGHWTNLYALTK